MEHQELIEKNIEFKENLKDKVNYIVIAITSVVTLGFLPLIGSTIGLGWNLPDSTVGWIVYVTTRLIVAGVNVLIFHSFIQQGKINSKGNKKYQEANEILGRVKLKTYIPHSPEKYFSKMYTSKGVKIFFSTLGTTIALTQALLQYDYATFLTYLFTIVFGLIFGVLNMLKAEEYWTNEYYDYAIKCKEELGEKQNA